MRLQAQHILREIYRVQVTIGAVNVVMRKRARNLGHGIRGCGAKQFQKRACLAYGDEGVPEAAASHQFARLRERRFLPITTHSEQRSSASVRNGRSRLNPPVLDLRPSRLGAYQNK